MAREPREVWAKRVERWTESGLTGGQFAAEIGVKEGTLRHWRWALAREAREPGWETSAARRRRAERRPQFVEVIAGPPKSAAASGCLCLELVLGAGILVRVPVGFDPDSLRRLLDLLRER